MTLPPCDIPLTGVWLPPHSCSCFPVPPGLGSPWDAPGVAEGASRDHPAQDEPLADSLRPQHHQLSSCSSKGSSSHHGIHRSSSVLRKHPIPQKAAKKEQRCKKKDQKNPLETGQALGPSQRKALSSCLSRELLSIHPSPGSKRVIPKAQLGAAN